MFLNKSKSGNLRNYLIRGAASSFGLKLVTTALAFCTSFVLARLFGKEGLGLFTFATACASLLGIPATLGFSQLLIREFATYQTQSAWGLMRGLFNWSTKVVLLFSVGFTLVVMVIAGALGVNLNSQMGLALGITCIAIPFTSLRNLSLAGLKGLHQVVRALLPIYFFAPLLLLILVGGGHILLGTKMSIYMVLGMKVFVVLLTLGLSLGWLSQAIPAIVWTAVPEYKSRFWLKSALPFMFLEGVQILHTRTDILMLGAMKGPEEVGIYAVVTRGVQLIVFISGAVGAVLAPTIAHLYAEGDVKKLQRIVTKSTRIVFLVSILASGGLIGCSYWFLLLFGQGFTQGQIALMILSVGKLGSAAMGSVNLLLAMTRHEKFLALTFGMSGVLNLLLNFLLIPQWGINGAATTTMFTTLAANIINAVWVWRTLGINSTPFGTTIGP